MKEKEKELTIEAFLAVAINKLRGSPVPFYWLCICNETRRELIDNSLVEFKKWKARELEMEQIRGISNKQITTQQGETNGKETSTRTATG